MTFSVVIPMFNRANVIKRAIDSVLGQTYQDFEIVVVDDGSTDDSVTVVKSYNDKRIRLIHQENSGATAARNNGISNSYGTYVSFLDSDDYWFDNMLAEQLKTYNSDNEIGFVYSNVNYNVNGKHYPFNRPLGIFGDIYADVLKQGYLAPTSVISAKRDLLIKVGMFDSHLPASQDDDMCFKLSKYTKVGYIPKVMALMYFDTDNRISDSKAKVANGWWMLWNKYASDVVEYCGKDVLAMHYYECALSFAKHKKNNEIEQCLQKIESLGQKLDIKQKIKIRLLLTGLSFIERIAMRLL